MHDDPELTLLERYVSGDCSPVERTRVERWLVQRPENRRRVEELRRLHGVVRAIDASEPAWNTRAMWQELQRQLPPATSRTAAATATATTPAARRAPAMHLHRTGGTWQRSLLHAAAIAVAAGGAFVLWRTATPDAGDLRDTMSQAMPTQVAATHIGQRTTVRLPDGTIATIAARSTLAVGDHYGEAKRDVYLVGEGYFEVASDPARPFRVHSGRSVTQVLGTKFSVQAYEDESTVTVMVAEGRVAFAPTGATSPSGQVVLSRGDRAQEGLDRVVHIERGVDVERALAWTRGRLEFVNVPMADAARSISRWYHVVLEVDPSLARAPLTASFGLESLEDVLQLLALSLNARVERDGQKVVMRPKS